jgi:hypothetical protein
MKHSSHSRKIRQLDRLVKAMKQAMLERQPKAQVEKIRLKIALILQQLRGILSSKQLVKKLGAFAVLFGLSATSYAQTFSAPVANPFGFSTDSTSYVGGICFADFDNDGDLDMMMGGYYGAIDYYENTGGVTSPSFNTAAQSNAFGLTSSIYYAFLTTTDLDNDGDFDVLAGEYYGNLKYFENTGTAASPAFAAAQTNPFGMAAGYYLSMPEFVDIDNDGDYDLFVGEANGNIQYYENTGSASSPAFSAPQSLPFGLTAAYSFAYPTFADLDQDGDMDLLINEIYGNFQYYENTGTASAPAFSAQQTNPFGITAAPDIGLSALVDIDGDGDYDIMTSGYYGNLYFYENTEFNVGIDELENTASVVPNPFVSQVKITSETAIELVEVRSLSGAIVHSEVKPGNNVNLDALNSGVYLIKIIDQNGHVSQQKIQKL